ncbi:hypothetical protein [Halalkalibacter okhensis]|uniref:Uncharacterized protein n=1 Tax=Halalkalibacter okhensis TaxID=333138 RepID=A0A0B0IGT2_9BACI|nr:hypothetical protein [Halalkalibacter okhensis]KHF39269.1 hypothetical protein LQ50_16340 [Halalkalibacter okhensis]
MKDLNVITLILYFSAIVAISTGILIQIQFDMSDGTVILISIGSLFGGFLLIGIAELIRVLTKISRQLVENK